MLIFQIAAGIILGGMFLGSLAYGFYEGTKVENPADLSFTALLAVIVPCGFVILAILAGPPLPVETGPFAAPDHQESPASAE